MFTLYHNGGAKPTVKMTKKQVFFCAVFLLKTLDIMTLVCYNIITEKVKRPNIEREVKIMKIIKAAELKAGMQVPEADGFLFDVVEIVKEAFSLCEKI